MMKKAKFDEFQLANRHRIAFQTLFIAIALIGVNGFIKENYLVWAPPYLESLVLIYIPMMYFFMMSIAKNAYLSRRDHPVLLITLFGFVAFMSLLPIALSAIDGEFHLIEHGQLSDRIGGLLLGISFGGGFVASLIRRVLDRRAMKNDD